MFKIGDKVLFKHEDQTGYITRIDSSNKVTVSTADGFEIIISKHHLVKIERGTDIEAAYGSSFHIKDKITAKKRYLKEKSKNKSIAKIDLHIELLTPYFDQMDNFDIVQMQLDVCQKKIDEILNSTFQKLIIVHGIGSGILKKEVHALLESYHLRFFLSKDGGSTEVML